MEKKLAISHFTDPMCFWCYAMEPEMRKLRVLLGEQLEYRIVMGVLSTDVHEIIGADAEAELRYELVRERMANHLAEAAKAVGMPVSLDGLMTRNPEDYVSLPLSLAYCAMKLIDEGVAEAYLRRMREVVYAEGRSLASLESRVQLAGEFPVDVEQFRENLEGDAAVPVLQEGIDECWTYSATVFPTLLIQYGSQRMAIRGYHDFDSIRQAIAQVTAGEIMLSDAEYSEGALEAFVDRFGKVAAREVQTMFSLNDTQLANVMMDLATTGRYKTQSCGTSYFIMPK